MIPKQGDPAWIQWDDPSLFASCGSATALTIFAGVQHFHDTPRHQDIFGTMNNSQQTRMAATENDLNINGEQGSFIFGERAQVFMERTIF